MVFCSAAWAPHRQPAWGAHAAREITLGDETPEPTAVGTYAPSELPSATPTAVPTETALPTVNDTAAPTTAAPTWSPTSAPTNFIPDRSYADLALKINYDALDG